jgi:hypothetical protein
MKKNVRKNAGMLLLMLSLCGVGTVLAQDSDLMVCSDKGYTHTNATPAKGASTYQWYENGTPVPGANQTTLTIDVGTKAPGTYAYVRVAAVNQLKR